MRTPEDIVNFTFTVHGSGSLDLERVEEDPIWRSVLLQSLRELEYTQDFEDEAVARKAAQEAAIQRYIFYYLVREELLTNNPGANGPAMIREVTFKVPVPASSLDLQKETSSNGSTSSSPSSVLS
jgi:hypothetical protein